MFCINTHTHLLYDYRIIYNIRKIMKSLDLVFDLILLTNLKRFDYRVKCAFFYFFKPTLGYKLYGAFTVNSISLTSTHSRFLPHTLLHSRTQHTIFLCTSIRIYTRDWIVKFFMFRISPVFFILFQFFYSFCSLALRCTYFFVLLFLSVVRIFEHNRWWWCFFFFT